MNEELSDLPQAETADPDGVQVALRAAQTLWSRGETSESLKWLRKAAESASDEGADVRSLQLAKAAAELRAKLFGGSERPRAGEVSGAHPVADPLGRATSQPEGVRSSSFPAEAADPFAGGADPAAGHSSRPVTATQYPSHRPRQRIGLTSAVPGASLPPREAAYGTRESAAYAAVPSWSADSERRVSAAPPPLPLAGIDDYEELEAEPDDEPAADPGFASRGLAPDVSRGAAPGVSRGAAPGVSRGAAPGVWSGAAPDSWGSAAPDSWRVGEPGAEGAANEPSEPHASPGGLFGVSSVSGVPGAAVTSSGGVALGSAVPPPLPPRGAFSDDDGDFGLLPEPATLMIPPPVVPSPGEAEVASRDARRVADSWDRESRVSGWDHDSSWAAELRSAAWGGVSSAGGASFGGVVFDGAPGSADLGATPAAPNVDTGGVEPPSPSDAARAKLTARVHHQAVRVSFAPDLRVPGQYVVRPLREGEKAAAGERIALLVALEPGVPLV